MSHIYCSTPTISRPHVHTSNVILARELNFFLVVKVVWSQQTCQICWWKLNLVEVDWDSSTMIHLLQTVNVDGAIMSPSYVFPNYSSQALGTIVLWFLSYIRKCIIKRKMIKGLIGKIRLFDWFNVLIWMYEQSIYSILFHIRQTMWHTMFNLYSTNFCGYAWQVLSY